MAEICTNCNKNVDDETKSSTSPENRDNEIGVIRIWDIIAYIYRIGSISFDDFRIYFKKINHHQKDPMEQSLRMCDLCLSLISDTYKAFKKFESLTHQASFIQHVQNTFKKQWENCTRTEPSNISDPNSSSKSSLAKNGNGDLFDAFNFEDQEADECSAEDYKYESTETGPLSLLMKEQSLNVGDSREKSILKNPLKSSKQLVVKVEKISTGELQQYNKNTKKDTTKKMAQFKRRKIKRNTKKCSSVTKRKYLANQHKKEKQLTHKDNKKYKCKICGKKFANRESLRQFHMPSHFQDCKLCDKVLTSVRGMQLHMKIIHKEANEEELKKYFKTCEICGKTIRANGFKVHMAIHQQRDTLRCDKCNKEYVDKFSYEAHLLTHSDNYTPYLCRHCGMTFNDKHSLHTHEKRHTEENKYSCEICSKTFSGKVNLKTHLAIHSEEKTFVCDECGVSYKQKSQLKRHQKIHKDVAEKGEYSSKCQYCERIFKHSVSLKRHLKVHESKYECSFCGKILSKPDILRKHEDLLRKNPDYQPRKYKTWKSDIARQPKPNNYVTSASAPSI